MPSPRRLIPLLLPVALLAVSGCFEPPVVEKLLLMFLPEAVVTVTASVEIDALDGDNRQLRQRVEETRQALADGRDDWSRRLEAMRPVHERIEIEKLEGKVTRAVRSGTTDDPEALRRFFADFGVHAEWSPLADGGELSIAPGSSGLASRREREEVERALDTWSAAIAEYLEATSSLFEYLEGHPERARATFGRLFQESLSEPVAAGLAELLEAEEVLVAAVEQGMESVSQALLVAAGEAYSLDEKSRRVHDPFPAGVTIRVPGDIVETEGFAAAQTVPASAGEPRTNELRVRELGMWPALRGLEGTWVAPDPLLAAVAHDLHGNRERGFDLDRWLSRERRAEDTPAPAEIRRRLEQQLEPVALYRVVWRAPE